MPQVDLNEIPTADELPPGGSPKRLFLIPARSGSKGVPGKNVMKFGRLTAIGMRVRSILASEVGGDIVCSTDSEEYAALAQAEGARAPFLRPSSLASDGASTADVILHALDWLREHEGKSYDQVVIAEPSSPFVRPADISCGCRLLDRAELDSVVSVKRAEVASRFLAPLEDDGSFPGFLQRLGSQDLRRQAQRPEFTPNGCFYGSKVSHFMAHRTIYAGRLYAFVMDHEYSVEIDSPLDARFAQFLWEKGVVEHSLWEAAR
jgi:CMP-N,N'-diacetyllegionaminic acid synthase